jgi:hypothetical protein
MIFRELSPEEEVKFRQWAQKNFDPERKVEEVWHPVIRDEWTKLLVAMKENGVFK